MRSFIAIGGGVGIGTLGVTHGLGPEQAKPPPPPTPTAQVSSPWEREENWRRKRQRDAQDFAAWRFYSDPAQQKQRRESEARARAEGARVEQERIRAADLLYRFRPEGTEGKPVWGPPLGAFAESAATTPAPEDVYATAGDVPTVVAEATPTTLPEPIEGVEIRARVAAGRLRDHSGRRRCEGRSAGRRDPRSFPASEDGPHGRAGE